MSLHGLNVGVIRHCHQSRARYLTSFKNTPVTTRQNAQNTAENRHGRRYGYSSQNQFPNKVGNLSWGGESTHPRRDYWGRVRIACVVHLGLRALLSGPLPIREEEGQTPELGLWNP